MAEVFQESYERRFQKGFVGGLALPNWPCKNVLGVLHVTDGRQAPRPGDGVLWSDANDGWILPGTDAQRNQCTGIIGYNPASLTGVGDTSSPDTLTFKDGDITTIWLMGVVWCVADVAMKFQDWVIPADMDDDAEVHQWDKIAAPGNTEAANLAGTLTESEVVSLMRRYRFQNVTVDDVAAGGLFMCSIEGTPWG